MEGVRVEATVSQELAEAMGEAVSSGDYGSEAEVVRDALRDWRDRRQARAMEKSRLRAGWAEMFVGGERGARSWDDAEWRW